MYQGGPPYFNEAPAPANLPTQYPPGSPPYPQVSPPYLPVSPPFSPQVPASTTTSPHHLHVHQLSPPATPTDSTASLRQDLLKSQFHNCLHDAGVKSFSYWNVVQQKIR